MASLALKSWRLQIFPNVFGSPTAASLKEIDDLTHQEPVLPDEDPVALPPPSLLLPEEEEKDPEKSEKSEKAKAEVETPAQFASGFFVDPSQGSHSEILRFPYRP